MSNNLFKDVVTLYEKNASPTIIRYRIEHPTLGNYCVSFNKFVTLLGEMANDNYWRKFLIPLKRLQFGLCAAPFSEVYRSDRISTIVSELQQHLRLCHKLYPDLAEHAFAVLSLLSKLIDHPEDPLLDKLLELTNVEHNTAWVIKESRLIVHVEELVANHQLSQVSVVHPNQLRDLTCYDQLITIGPSRWFPESVFTAPRASQIEILIFDWIKDRWKPQNVFSGPHKSYGSSTKVHINVEERETDSHWDNISPEELLIIIDKASALTSTMNRESEDEFENVVAMCLFLENDWVVFIDSSEGAKALVIDPDEDADNRISRIFAREIKPGMFILVRIGDGGDYIVSVANKIMGSQAHNSRQCQKRWKELLRNYVRRNGLLESSIDLLDLGSNVANETNVRNWMSPRSICTQKYNDFLAIMKLVGLENNANEYWNIMRRINRAHHKAGFEIRNLLLEQVKDLDIEILQKNGKMDFKLSSDDEGGLTAFRVESVLPEAIEVSYSRIGQPFQLEHQLWRE